MAVKFRLCVTGLIVGRILTFRHPFEAVSTTSREGKVCQAENGTTGRAHLSF